MADDERGTLDEGAKAERSLDEGDYAAARRHARAALDSGPDEARKKAVRVLARLRPDPLVLAIYVASLAVFVLAILRFARR